ncbi:MAG: hypothetical protein K2M87_04750 [Muribaculaceae bacterium]|nr:hypothetical protein [Muribaculaceae bacterium]
MFRNHDNEENDFFENSEIPESSSSAKREEEPHYSPDDPRYWEGPEDEFEHLRPAPRSHWRLWVWIGAAGLAIGIIWGVWLRLFSPYVQDAWQYGYVEKIEKRGEVFHTYEGVILPYRNLMDTTRVYSGDFEFSASDPKVAARLIEAQFDNRPIRVHYRMYHTRMPWRGDTKTLVVGVDSVLEKNILPPDRQPETLVAP